MIGVNRTAFDLGRAHILSFAIAVLALIAAGCGSGSSVAFPGASQLTATPTPIPTPIPTPTPPPTPPPVSVSTTFPVSSSAVAEPLPPYAPFTEVVNFPGSSAAPGTTLTVTVTNALPLGVPGLPLPRPPAHRRWVKAFYLVFEDSASVTYQGLPGFQFSNIGCCTLIGCCTPFWMALYDPTQTSPGWQLGIEGPGVLSGSTVSFAGLTMPFTFASKTSYVFAFYWLGDVFPCC